MSKPSESDVRRGMGNSVFQRMDYMSSEANAIPCDGMTEPNLCAVPSSSTFEDPEIFDGPVFPLWDTQPHSLKAFWRNQKAAVEEIHKCIDRGTEIVDLSEFGLEKLQDSTLQPLQYLVAQRRPPPPGVQWQRFDSFIPEVQLFLANNSLSRLPGQLFRLHNLTVLSLRHNNLTELPSAIRSLVNLRELNVSNNRLQWLPYEIQRLLRKDLKMLRLHPNPFIQPVVSSSDGSRSLTPHPPRTRPAFLRNDGALARGSPPSPVTTSACWTDLNVSTPNEKRFSDDASKVPSLFEVSLRACYDLPQLGQLPLYLPIEAPESLTSALKHTWKLKQQNGQRCTICTSSYIVPRTEWIEWWPLLGRGTGVNNADLGNLPQLNDIPPTSAPFPSAMENSFIPLLRRGCSWLCVPDSSSNGNIVGWSSAADIGQK
ncbi:MAG: hypothetical protein Q9186_000593 [Xanthomendoza sp. 1 TL-2023]